LSSFNKYGLVEHVPPKQKNLGQKRDTAKKQLENIVSDFPQMSIRKGASAVGVSPTLVYHIFTDDLHLKSSKVSFMVLVGRPKLRKKAKFLSSVS